MFRLVDFLRPFANIRPIGRMRLIKNFSRTLCKVSSMNSGDGGKTIPNQSTIPCLPDAFHCLDILAVRNWLT